MPTKLVTFIPIKEVIPYWPSDKFQIPGLEKVGLSRYEVSPTNQGLNLEATLLLLEELKISMPGLDGIAFLIGRGDGFTEIDVAAQLGDAFAAQLKNLELRLRFSSSLLKPMKKVEEKYVVDEARKYAEVSGRVSFSLDAQANLGFEAGNTFGISKPVMIGSTGVIIETMQLALNLGGKGSRPAGTREGWQGLYIEQASLRIPSVFEGALSAKGFGIGHGGISGTLDYTNPKGERLLGMDAKLTRIALTFQQSIPTDTSIEGSIKLPFFDDWLSIAAAIGFDGDVMVRLANPKGATKLEIKDVLKFELNGISFESKQGVFTAKLSGKLTPTLALAGISWPSFEIKELSIDSTGKVKLEGGWQELSRPQTLKLAGVRIEVSKIGFGTTEDGRKWLGLNGAVRLVEGVSAGGSVDGLSIVWDDSGKTAPEVTFNGIGVEMKIPDVLDFSGAISYADKRFVGKIKLTLHPLDKAQIDAVLVVGEAEQPAKYTYLAIYLAGEWNTGIPIGPVGLYGMAGLFALNYEPDKTATEAWYEDPTNQEAAKGWYKKPQVGVTDLEKKWHPQRDSLAFGAGVTLGVLPKNGFPFNGRLLLVIAFPGPIVMLEGRANLLKERAKLGDDPLFRALAVLDGRQGTFEFGLDAKYAYDKEGALIDIAGSAHGFFGAPDHWHLYIGQQTPKEKRIRARLFKLFLAQAYFMLDNRSLRTGAWLGYAPEPLKFGPVKVVLEAWIDGNAAVNWQPAQFHGDLSLHGKVGLQIFFVRLGLAVDAEIAADVFDPFYLMAKLGINVELWPFPPLSVQAKLEWRPEKVTWPPLPLPLKEVAAAHPLVSTSWPLPRDPIDGDGPLLLPDYRSAGQEAIHGFYQETEFNQVKMPASDAATRDGSPVLPMDARLHISFNQAVHDDILIGDNSRAPAEYVEIGNPEKSGENPISARFGLAELSLERWDGSIWNPKARLWLDGGKPQATGKRLFGSWAPIPAMERTSDVEQTKLWLWSETPFDYTRNSGKALEEWYTERLPSGPCIPVPPPRDPEIYTFSMLGAGDTLSSGWAHPNNSELTFQWDQTASLTPLPLSPDFQGYTLALQFPSTYRRDKHGRRRLNWLTIQLPSNVPEPHRIAEANLLLLDEEAVSASSDGKVAVSPGTHTPHPVLGVNNQLFQVDATAVPGQALTHIRLRGSATLCVLELRLVYDLTDRARSAREERMRRVLSGISHWNQEGQLLEPYSQYRLKIITTVRTQGRVHALTAPSKTPEQQRTLIEYAYFQTQGPPGLTQLARPLGLGAAEFSSGLEDLSAYLVQTTPPCIPPRGAKRIHPKPHYRAYDVSAEFSVEADYVDLMYRLAGRGLMLYLYDNNDQPVRDAQGRLVVSAATWEATKETRLKATQQRFLALLENCAKQQLPPVELPQTLTVAATGRTLAGDTVYEARLKPLLFSGELSLTHFAKPADASGLWSPSIWKAGHVAALDVDEQAGEMRLEGTAAWQVKGAPRKIGVDASVSELSRLATLVNQARRKGQGLYTLFLEEDRNAGTQTYLITSISAGDKRILLKEPPRLNGHTRWSIQPGLDCLVQSSNIWGGSDSDTAIEKPGTLLPLAQGAQWSDYRFEVTLRSCDDDALGVAFRYLDADNHYLFTLDRQRRYRRLIRVSQGRWTLLGADEFVYRKHQDYLVTVEAVGERISIFLDGDPVFSVTDSASQEGQPSPALLKGGIALYSWANTGASFRGLSVDDLSHEAVVVYRFPFTTSRFAHFTHQIQSFQDRTWTLAAPEGLEWKNTQAFPATGSDTTPPGAAEARSYESIAKKLLGTGHRKLPQRQEVTRILDEKGGTAALLLRGPEPLDWRRTRLEIAAGHTLPRHPVEPGVAKLTHCSAGGSSAGDEWVELLVRDPVELSHARIEYLRFPDPTTRVEEQPLLCERFQDSLEEEAIGQQLWAGSPTDFVLQADLRDEKGQPLANSKPWRAEGVRLLNSGGHSLALIGDLEWMDYQLSVDLTLDTKGEAGLLLRYRDEHNHYRLGLSGKDDSWRLTVVAGGTTKPLAQGTLPNSSGHHRKTVEHKLRFRLQGAELSAYWGRRKLFGVHDASHHRGRCGLFAAAAEQAVFKEIEVADYTRRLGQWQLHDLGDPRLGPSRWKIMHGALWQRSNIWDRRPTHEDPALLGTFATAGGSGWRDYRLSALLRSDDDDAIGIMVRYTDPGNYYLLVSDRQLGYTRLIRMLDGQARTLWPSAADVETPVYTVGTPFRMELEVQGGRIQGYLDGQRLFSLSDQALPNGGVGLFAWANTGASFTDVQVRGIAAPSYALFTDTFETKRKWRRFGSQTAVTPQTQGAELVLEEDKGLWAGSTAWKEYIYSLRTQLAEGGRETSALFYYTDAQNHYRLRITRDGLALSRVHGGESAEIWKSQHPISADQRYELIIQIANEQTAAKEKITTIELYLDGSPLARIRDRHGLTQGAIGCTSGAGSRAAFSALSVLPTRHGFDHWLLKEDFDQADLNAWSVHDEVSNESGPSQWAVSGGELQQTSNIFGYVPGSRKKHLLGTLIVTGTEDWSDYRFTCEFRSDDDDAVGVIFRYQDPRNHYRLFFDQERKLSRLTKVSGGEHSILWEQKAAVSLKRWQLLTLDLLGRRLTAHLDGTPLFDLRDDQAITSGKVGLFCWANDSARFRGIRVAEAAWMPFYLFGEEPATRVGNRIAVCSGSAETAGSSAPAQADLLRFAGETGSPNLPRLRSGAELLRLQRGDGKVEHARYFSCGLPYQNKPLRLLRNADGTGFFLLPPEADNTFPEGSIKCRFTYQRNPGGDLPVLREAGSDREEVTEIDLE